MGAGAGTGKTKTLTAHYVANLLALPPDELAELGSQRILAITYTKAAAAELAERIRGMLRDIGRDDLARQMGDAWISTIHSFCQRVLRLEAPALYGAEVTDPLFGTIEPLEASALRSQALDDVFARWAREERAKLEMVLRERKKGAVRKTVTAILGNCASWGYPVERVLVPGAPGAPRTAAGIAQSEYPWDARATALSQAIVDIAVETAARFRELKADRSVLDYGDLIERVHSLFHAHPEVAARYRDQFSRIIIDEFQDTNAVQYSIFRQIARDNLSIVGDKNQSIYAFQGAQAEVFDRARADLTGNTRGTSSGGRLELGSNYRSHADVLEFVNAAFTTQAMFGDDGLVRLRHARDEARPGVDTLKESSPAARVVLAPILGGTATSKPPRGSEETGATVGGDTDLGDSAELTALSPADREAVWIANWVERLHREQDPPVPLSDIKVIVRSRTNAPRYVAELRARNIPALVVGGVGLLDDPIVRATLALVRVLDNPNDEPSLIELLISPYGRVPDQTLADLAINKKSSSNVVGLWGGVQAAVEQGTACADLVEIYAAIQLARESLGVMGLDAVLRSVVTQRGVDLMMLAAAEKDVGSGAGLKMRQSYENLMAFIELAGRWDRAGSSARAFAADIDGYIEDKETMELPKWSDGSEGGEAVAVMTIHATKGLEFPVVIFPPAAMSDTDHSNGACKVGFVPAGDDGGHVWVAAYAELSDEEAALAKGLVSADTLPADNFGLDKKPRPRYMSPEYLAIEAHRTSVEQQEMRRLMYVAVTRARDLVLVGHRVTPKADGGSDKDGSSVWHAMLRERILQGEYPNYSLTDEHRPYDLQLDLSMVGHGPGASRRAAGAQPVAQVALPSEECVGTSRDDEFAPRRAIGPSRLVQVSASHLVTHRRCPRLYYLQSIANVGTLRNTDPSEEANLGNALHAVLELHWRSSRVDLSGVANILETHRIDPALQQGIVDLAQRLLGSSSLSELRDPAYSVVTERQFYEPISNSGDQPPLFLQGYIDVFALGADGEARVLDYKTGRGSPREHHEIQARCYGLVGLRSGAERVDVRFMMPGAAKADIARWADVELDGDIAYHRFTFTSEDRAVIESEVLEASRAMLAAGDVDDQILREVVKYESCVQCGFRGPLCKVGASRARSR